MQWGKKFSDVEIKKIQVYFSAFKVSQVQTKQCDKVNKLGEIANLLCFYFTDIADIYNWTNVKITY